MHVVGADTTNRYSCVAAGISVGANIGEDKLKIVRSRDIKYVELSTGQRADRDRDILQRLLTLLRGDNNLFELCGCR